MKNSRRRRKRYERILPKPDIIITDTPAAAPVAIRDLVPSKAKERPVYQATDEDNAAFERVLIEALDATGLGYEVDIEHGTYQRAQIAVDERQAGALIGRRGSSIDALELLVGRMASHQVGHNVPVQIDVNEYRKRLEDEIRDSALARAKRVEETGEDEHMPVMSARERRVVHLAIENMEGIETYTVGEGASKHIVIHQEKNS